MPPASLRDGTEVEVRPIAPEDAEALRAGFERLSPESRYRRFLAPMNELSDEMVRYFTCVDHRDHEALLAFDPETREAIGVARFVRHAGRPDAAEAAVTVADDWQGRGLGTLLLELLAARAREERVTTFTALVLADNDDMLDLLEHLGPTHVVDRSLGTVEVEAELPPIGLSPELRALLRASRRARPPGVPGGTRPHVATAAAR